MNLKELVATTQAPSNINANTLDIVAVATPDNKWGVAFFDGIKPRETIVGGLTPSKVHTVIKALKGPGSAYAEVKAELDRFILARNAANAEADEAYDASEKARLAALKKRPSARR